MIVNRRVVTNYRECLARTTNINGKALITCECKRKRIDWVILGRMTDILTNSLAIRIE